GVPGLRQSALTATDSTASDKAFVNLSGTALNNTTNGTPALGLIPPPAPACTQDNAFTFCSQALHTASGTQNFLLTAGNTTTGLTYTIAAAPGLTSEFALGDFNIASNACGATLAGGSSCLIGVQFMPTAAGARAAILKVTATGGDSAQVYLAGNTSNGLSLA